MSKIYGYCRISTPSQSIDRQVRNILAKYPDADIKKEAFTGRTIHRPVWERLMKALRAGDTVVFDSASRMSRSADEGCQTYLQLYDMGVELIFLNEPMVNTSTYRNALKRSVPMTGTAVDCILQGINDYFKVVAEEQFRLAFQQSQKEVDDLSTRTKGGMETARRNGKQIGQKAGAKLHSKLEEKSKEIILQHSKTFGGSLSDADCMKLCGCSRNSYYKYKAELKETAGAD